MNNAIKENDWDRRIVDFFKIHGDSSEALEVLVKDLDIQEGEIVTDLMCGYGEVSKYLLEYSTRKGIDFNLFLVDHSQTQLDRSREFLKEYKYSGKVIARRKEDIRNLKLPKNYFDSAIIKMGLHEIPKEEHVKALSNVTEIVKPGGRVYVWESFGDDRLNDYFKAIVRKKDEVAGFHEISRQRYFSGREELIDEMREAGLVEVKQVYSGLFEYNSERFFKTDFDYDDDKHEELKDYMRRLIPYNLREKCGFVDTGDSVTLRFTKATFVGKKPQIDFTDSG